MHKIVKGHQRGGDHSKNTEKNWWLKIFQGGAEIKKTRKSEDKEEAKDNEDKDERLRVGKSVTGALVMQGKRKHSNQDEKMHKIRECKRKHFADFIAKKIEEDRGEKKMKGNEK